MPNRLRVAAITDEFSPDLETAARAMASLGMEGAELRVIFGKNAVDLTDDELARALAIVRGHGLEVVSIASPLLKCVLPDAPELDARFQQDVFASRHTFEDQPRLAARTFEIAARAGARIVRVFSYWRTVRPRECFPRIVEALGSLADRAAREGLVVGLENEHACNVSTGRDVAEILAELPNPNLQVVWDPANALVSGELPFPDGYNHLPPARIAHVHAKNCYRRDGALAWGPLDDGLIDWSAQAARLVDDGYAGWLSLETHWPGPGGDKLEASRICGRKLIELAHAAPARTIPRAC